MLVELKSVGNPDLGQNPNKPMSEPRMATVNTFDEASAVCREYIGHNFLGGGNWSGGQVRLTEDGPVIATVSFNGRVWIAAQE